MNNLKIAPDERDYHQIIQDRVADFRAAWDEAKKRTNPVDALTAAADAETAALALENCASMLRDFAKVKRGVSELLTGKRAAEFARFHARAGSAS